MLNGQCDVFLLFHRHCAHNLNRVSAAMRSEQKTSGSKQKNITVLLLLNACVMGWAIDASSTSRWMSEGLYRCFDGAMSQKQQTRHVWISGYFFSLPVCGWYCFFFTQCCCYCCRWWWWRWWCILLCLLFNCCRFNKQDVELSACALAAFVSKLFFMTDQFECCSIKLEYHQTKYSGNRTKFSRKTSVQLKICVFYLYVSFLTAIFTRWYLSALLLSVVCLLFNNKKRVLFGFVVRPILTHPHTHSVHSHGSRESHRTYNFFRSP